ncbi:glycosyltransferase family 4 protein [Vibrio sp. TH_r3]|uniref:glycosyltransferase family 4 protein n=1 Tax=Vibrio sp. TH_r3 TaxID=3082084 RepID=UPI0029532713|nr:glycosyltransferase family 4 protein [Vibrio sp. TH_r3]MDV7106407.1 glycosyltransferase family 4 protein [Vibrio sp. TH_r3]
MKIALSHYRVGETDGVSLEMDKWALILEQLGHEVVYIAGSQGSSERTTYLIDEMALLFPEDEALRMELYLHQDKAEQELKLRSNKLKQLVAARLEKILIDEKIDVLVPNNICCLGRSIPIGDAFAQVIKKTGIKVVNHHHDFYWEREFFSGSKYPFAKKSLQLNFPPLDKNIKHCVINTLAKADLKTKKGVESIYIPNVFDFQQKTWSRDQYNQDFRSKLGISDNDLFFLQGTRLVARKGIELAVDVIKCLGEHKKQLIGKTLYNGKPFTENSRIVYAMVGLHEDHGSYIQLLEDKCKQSGIEFIIDPSLVDHERTIRNGKKIYSLWDAYVDCDFVMYPSIYEGWGNQLLEAMFARKPTLIFEYSVYEKDIKPVNCDFVSLGNHYQTLDNGLVAVSPEVIENATQQIVHILTDKERYQAITDKNFELGKQHFSYQTLQEKLQSVFTESPS